VGKESTASADSASRHYARASNRVAEVEVLLARQKGKIVSLRQLGFSTEADTARSALVKMEYLLQLCIEDRDRAFELVH